MTWKCRLKRRIRSLLTVFLALGTILCGAAWADEDAGEQSFHLQGKKIECNVELEGGKLAETEIVGRDDWLSEHDSEPTAIELPAGFKLDLMWTGWRPPGVDNNGDNEISLTDQDFAFVEMTQPAPQPSGKSIELLFKAKDSRIELKVTYWLGDDFFLRRMIAVRDTAYGKHFLRKMYPLHGIAEIDAEVVNDGGFGQPVALTVGEAGLFFGLEIPTATNSFEPLGDSRYMMQSVQEIGERIGSEWIESDWAVIGLTPDNRVRHWFFEYIKDIRIHPLRPYTLYNSWYDLRSPEYPDVEPGNVMNEANILKMIDLIRTNMIEKNNIKLDAFVLDDGWDIYKSDWEMRKETFPRGMKPISDKLRETDTDLGIWFSPIGGYSFRKDRIGWMKENGYEVVGSQLCLAGKNYSELFKKRVADFVAKEGAAYFKWDGVQYSCSEPDHGHPVGIYSRRAVFAALAEMCDTVRQINPDVFLNITSGTWLSPWWLKYADQIWMDGYDYGWADVPSISKRDAAITYRDFVLYEDFHIKKLWFPIANLMTHGIIKGNLQMLGGAAEPIDKFTDNALLYFARGTSMYELYISPDILTDAEWDAISHSLAWAKDRFDILQNTVMIGGDPTHRETYGYSHFSGDHGIVAVRNPFILESNIKVKLDPAHGLNPKATGLVLERVYPNRWISPHLVSAGELIDIPLEGYETAVYELYPLSEAVEPLLAGVVFETEPTETGMELTYYDVQPDARMLNPESVSHLIQDGQQVSAHDIALYALPEVLPVGRRSVQKNGSTSLSINVQLDESVTEATLAVLLKPEAMRDGIHFPSLLAQAGTDSLAVEIEAQKGLWSWYSCELSNGATTFDLNFVTDDSSAGWKGTASVWVICQQSTVGSTLTFDLAVAPSARVMPPTPCEPGLFRKHIVLGEVKLEL